MCGDSEFSMNSTFDWQALFGTPPAESVPLMIVLTRILVHSVLLYISSRMYHALNSSISNFQLGSSKVRDFCLLA